MVHRPPDSRLLSNLLAHEKDCSKQLNAFLDASNACLASFSAFAAASSPEVSHVVMTAAGSLAAADDALRRYGLGVAKWRDEMRQLKDMEDEVANVVRDREILVTRLLKAANKSQKSDPSRSPNSSSSSKLAAAQTELQACEAHLAAKERQLALKRTAAVHEGLTSRLRALAECGWAWNQLAKESLDSIHAFTERETREQHSRPPLIHEQPNQFRPHQPPPHHPQQHQLHLHSTQPTYLPPSRVRSDTPTTSALSLVSSFNHSRSASQVDIMSLPAPIPTDTILSAPETFRTSSSPRSSSSPRPGYGDEEGAIAPPIIDPATGNALFHPHSPPLARTSSRLSSSRPMQHPHMIGTSADPFTLYNPSTSNLNVNTNARPLSGISTGSSSYYTPATYTLETVKYAPAVSVVVPPSGVSSPATSAHGHSTSSGTATSPYAPIAMDIYDEPTIVSGNRVGRRTETTVRIPAAHRMSDYEIPTADVVVVQDTADIEGANMEPRKAIVYPYPPRGDAKSTGSGNGSSDGPADNRSEPQPFRREGSPTPSPAVQYGSRNTAAMAGTGEGSEAGSQAREVERGLVDGARYPGWVAGDVVSAGAASGSGGATTVVSGGKLKAKVEDGREDEAGSVEMEKEPVVVEVQGSSDEEEEARELKEEEQLIHEGKLNVVENPRFMSEERKRELGISTSIPTTVPLPVSIPAPSASPVKATTTQASPTASLLLAPVAGPIIGLPVDTVHRPEAPTKRESYAPVEFPSTPPRHPTELRPESTMTTTAVNVEPLQPQPVVQTEPPVRPSPAKEKKRFSFFSGFSSHKRAASAMASPVQAQTLPPPSTAGQPQGWAPPIGGSAIPAARASVDVVPSHRVADVESIDRPYESVIEGPVIRRSGTPPFPPVPRADIEEAPTRIAREKGSGKVRKRPQSAVLESERGVGGHGGAGRSPNKTFLNTLKVLFAPNKSAALVKPKVHHAEEDLAPVPVGTSRVVERALVVDSSEDERVPELEVSRESGYHYPHAATTVTTTFVPAPAPTVMAPPPVRPVATYEDQAAMGYEPGYSSDSDLDDLRRRNRRVAKKGKKVKKQKEKTAGEGGGFLAMFKTGARAPISARPNRGRSASEVYLPRSTTDATATTTTTTTTTTVMGSPRQIQAQAEAQGGIQQGSGYLVIENPDFIQRRAQVLSHSEAQIMEEKQRQRQRRRGASVDESTLNRRRTVAVGATTGGGGGYVTAPGPSAIDGPRRLKKAPRGVPQPQGPVYPTAMGARTSQGRRSASVDAGIDASRGRPVAADAPPLPQSHQFQPSAQLQHQVSEEEIVDLGRGWDDGSMLSPSARGSLVGHEPHGQKRRRALSDTGFNGPSPSPGPTPSIPTSSLINRNVPPSNAVGMSASRETSMYPAAGVSDEGYSHSYVPRGQGNASGRSTVKTGGQPVGGATIIHTMGPGAEPSGVRVPGGSSPARRASTRMSPSAGGSTPTKRRQGSTGSPMSLNNGSMGTLGQGMPLASSSPSPPRRRVSTTSTPSPAPPIPGSTTITTMHATPPAPSLMRIVEDVTRANTYGQRTSSTQVPLRMGDVPRAPKSMSRAELMRVDEDRLARFSGDTDISTPPAISQLQRGRSLNRDGPTSGTSMKWTSNGMVEIPRAPGPVVDQLRLHERLAGGAASGDVNLVRRSSERPAKSPFKSALKSRTPSPAVGGSLAPPISQPSTQYQHIPGAFPDATSAVGAGLMDYGGPSRQPLPQNPPAPGGTAEVERRRSTTSSKRRKRLSGSATDSSYTTGQEFYTDEGEGEEEEQDAKVVVKSYEHQLPPGKGVSDSTASTGMHQHEQPLRANGAPMEPRRRKSVRVSLKPTFSPSPEPQTPYDEAEFNWEGRPATRVQHAVPSTVPIPAPIISHSRDIAAPSPVSAADKSRMRSINGVDDMWANSSDEEDDAYTKAKLALTRATKKEKDVGLWVSA